MSRPRTRPTAIVGIARLPDDQFARPILDEDRLLRFRDRWVAVTDLQTPVVELLLRNLGRAVSRDDIIATYRAAGGSGEEPAILSLMRRIAKHFTDVGARVAFGYRSQAMVVVVPPLAT